MITGINNEPNSRRYNHLHFLIIQDRDQYIKNSDTREESAIVEDEPFPTACSLHRGLQDLEIRGLVHAGTVLRQSRRAI